MKYTFLLPAYKAKFLKETLNCIRQQTYTDFQVIISDDCSPENLSQIVEPYLLDPRFKYRRNKVNIGGENLVSHWNLLMNSCKSDFLIMASDDDLYEPTFLEKIDALTTKYPKVDLFHARACHIDEDSEVTMVDACYPEYASQLEYLSFCGLLNHVECIANYVYRTDKLKEIGGFVNFPYAWGSDTWTNNLMAANGCASTIDILFSFRMSGINISSKSKVSGKMAKGKLESAMQQYSYMENLFNSLPTSESKLYTHQYNLAKKVQIECINLTTYFYSGILNFSDLLKLIRFMKKNGYITNRYEIYKYLSKWLYCKIK